MQAPELYVASCNVLAEQPYRKWSKTALMPAQVRQVALANAFKSATAFAEANVLCLMEWDQFHMEQQLKTQGWHWINPRTPAARWGTTLAFKTSVFELEASDFGSVDGRYEHAAARLRHKTSGARVGIVSCHLPYSGPSVQLAAIMTRAASVLAVPALIVCGDFNTTDVASIARTLPGFTSVFPPNLPTSRNPSDHLVTIDYIWYRGLQPTLASVDPDLRVQGTGARLVAHAAGAQQTGDYFSDHCVLLTKFRLG